MPLPTKISNDIEDVKLNTGYASRGKSAIEEKPDQVAEAFMHDVNAMDGRTLAVLAEETGLPPRTLDSLLRRFRTHHGPLRDGLKQITTREIVKKLEEKAELALEYMDDLTFSQASLKDLAITLGILLEKRQLLNHEATVIIGTTERRHINELIPVMVEEAQRRGMLIEHDSELPPRVLPREIPNTADLSAAYRKMSEEPDREFN